MNSVFSVDDFLDPFWQGPVPAPETDGVQEPAAMNRSASEWAFNKCFQEFVVPASSSSSYSNVAPSVISQSTTSSMPENGEGDVVEIKKSQVAQNSTAPIDSEEYRAFLKSKLELACAAVAMSRASNVKPEDFPILVEDQRQPAKNSQPATQALAAQGEANVGPIGIPALPPMRKQEVQVRQTTSGSSREDSDDDDLEGDTGTNEHMDPADAKRARRMQSNRESAGRSRRRKQAQLNELETQVGQLRDERISLVSRHTDISKKCDEAAVDNRILKANIETLRVKVKMAEEQVKRVTGLNPMLVARNNMTNMGMQFAGGHADSSANVAVPMQQNSNQFFHQPVPSINPTTPHLPGLNNSYLNNTLVPHAINHQINHGTNNVARMNPMQITPRGQNMADMPSIQPVQDQVCLAGVLPAYNSGIPHSAPKDNKKK